MNLVGIITGACTFLIIGVCHPIVIKLEYALGRKGWIILLAVGLVLSAISISMKDNLWATIVGAGAFSCFWGIYEMFEQEKRVLRGWFPENPKRHQYYEEKRKSLSLDKQGSRS